ncbi:MAG: sensor histidine kinase, partial [Gammaproteobacteria bacterium]
MVLLLYVLNQGIQKLTENYVSSRLQHDADSLISALKLNDEGTWVLPHDKMSTVYNRVQSGHYYVIIANNQKIRSRSLFDNNPVVPKIKLNEYHLYTEEGVNKEYWLISVQKIKKKGDAITIWIAEDIAPLEQTQHKFLLFAAGAIVITIILLLLMQYQILQRGFSQLEQLRKSVKQLRLGKEEMQQQELPSEISPLVEEIGRLLGQLSQRVQRSRNALGNLAHELKRPL